MSVFSKHWGTTLNVLEYGEEAVDHSPFYAFNVIDERREAVPDTGTSFMGIP